MSGVSWYAPASTQVAAIQAVVHSTPFITRYVGTPATIHTARKPAAKRQAPQADPCAARIIGRSTVGIIMATDIATHIVAKERDGRVIAHDREDHPAGQDQDGTRQQDARADARGCEQDGLRHVRRVGPRR